MKSNLEQLASELAGSNRRMKSLVGTVSPILDQTSVADGEDAVQEVLVQLLDRPPHLQKPSIGGLVSLVKKAAVHDAINTVDRERRQLRLRVNHELPDEHGGGMRARVLEALAAAVWLLPDTLFEVVHMRFYEGLSGPAIREQLSLSLGAYKQRLARAFARLRKTVLEVIEGKEVRGN